MLISANSGLYSARPGKERFTMLEALDFFHELGFEAFDINFSATIYENHSKKTKEHILDGSNWRHNVAEVKNLAEKYGIQINTSHLPFFKYANPEAIPEYDFFQDMVYRSLDAAALIGVKWTVVHTSANADDVYNYVKPLCMHANPNGVGLAVENTIREMDATIEAVDKLKKDGFIIGMCYDTGHANVAGLNQKEAIHQLGDRLKMLHVHDNFGKDHHQPPFCGTINWTDVMEGLAEIGYTGDFNFETNSGNLPESLRYENGRYLIAAARELFTIYDRRMAELKK